MKTNQQLDCSNIINDEDCIARDAKPLCASCAQYVRSQTQVSPQTDKATARPHDYATTTIITRSKGGTGERKVALSSLHIPDVFNYDETPFGRSVVEVWHIAHDLKRELIERAEEHSALVAVVEDLRTIRDVLFQNVQAGTGITFHGAQLLSEMASKSLAQLAAVRGGKAVQS